MYVTFNSILFARCQNHLGASCTEVDPTANASCDAVCSKVLVIGYFSYDLQSIDFVRLKV